MSESHGATGHHGFSGPKCWVLSAIVGALLGLVVAFALPQGAASNAGHGDAPKVIQINPDGKRVERLTDGSTLAEGAAPATSTPGSSSGAGGASAAGHGVDVPLWLCAPFAVLLLSIALMPFVSAKFWHAHYPDFAFSLGAGVLTNVCVAMGTGGREEMLHAALEYYSFIALVGGLYLVSGGIVIDIRDQGSAARNTGLLAFGAVLANVLGTTGASVLLIKPFLRMNKGRLRPLHAVFFIFIVSNCGGCLTPIGDPPLYLGFLKGVPFFWTLEHMWPMWLTVNGALLAMFFVYDLRVPRASGMYEARAVVHDPSDRTPLIVGWRSVACLVLLVAGVFIDPLLKKYAGISGIPIGATFQIVVAITAYLITPASVRHSNQFSFEPLKEVGFLFVGIFMTMAPALAFLRGNAASLGLESPTQYYFLTGSLSAVLDNAPTYLSFLQVAMGTLHVPLTEAGVREFIAASYELTHQSGHSAGEVVKFQGVVLLEAISLGAVFFGAMTYIGNGPNFMVKSIVDAAYQQGQAPDAAPGQKLMGAKMPSFVGYVVLSTLVLLPVLVLNWLVFIR